MHCILKKYLAFNSCHSSNVIQVTVHSRGGRVWFLCCDVAEVRRRTIVWYSSDQFEDHYCWPVTSSYQRLSKCCKASFFLIWHFGFFGVWLKIFVWFVLLLVVFTVQNPSRDENGMTCPVNCCQLLLICFLLFVDFYFQSWFHPHLSYKRPKLFSCGCWNVSCCL